MSSFLAIAGAEERRRGSTCFSGILRMFELKLLVVGVKEHSVPVYFQCCLPISKKFPTNVLNIGSSSLGEMAISWCAVWSAAVVQMDGVKVKKFFLSPFDRSCSYRHSS